MEEVYEKIEYKGCDITIYYDSNPYNPRKMCDNLGTMMCFHSRYNLGDEHQHKTPEDMIYDLLYTMLSTDQIHTDYDNLLSTEFINKYLPKLEEYAFMLPLYLYDHSGLTMNTKGFSCPWDSGQVGWILVTKEKVREEYGVKRITPKLKEKVLRYLKAEVETYDNYLCGNVYGYIIECKELQCDCGSTIFDDTEDGCIKCIRCGYEADEDDFHKEEIDSCWGFFGDPEDYIISEAKSVIDNLQKFSRKEG